MAYKLRFVQEFEEGRRAEFLALEKQFAELEHRNPAFPKGERFLPLSGREPGHTLIWECLFDTLDGAFAALAFLGSNPDHEALYARQSKLFVRSYTEIYQTFEG